MVNPATPTRSVSHYRKNRAKSKCSLDEELLVPSDANTPMRRRRRCCLAVRSHVTCDACPGAVAVFDAGGVLVHDRAVTTRVTQTNEVRRAIALFSLPR